MSKTKMIQVRNVPDAVHKRLVAKAKKEGMSLSGYLLMHLDRLASLHSPAEMRERIARIVREEEKRTGKPFKGPKTPAADLIRAARDERVRHLDQVVSRRSA